MSPRFEDCQEMTLALIALEKVNKKTFHKPIFKNASHGKFTDGRTRKVTWEREVAQTVTSTRRHHADVNVTRPR